MAAPANLEPQLTRATKDLLRQLEGKRTDAQVLLTGGWMSRPIDLVQRATACWAEFLRIAERNRGELKEWISPLAVASGMQMLYMRFVWLWLNLPASVDDPRALHSALDEAITAEVRKFVGRVTN
jgi:hypothetical protein